MDDDAPSPDVGLLKFGDELTLPTEIYRLTESFNSSSPSEDDFVLATSEQAYQASNYYRHFKSDLSLTKAQATTPDEEVWSMRTKTGDYTRLNEIVGQSGAGSKTYFNPLLAAKVFLSKVCRKSVRRARQVFGEERDIKIHFTAPNFRYEGDGEEGKKKSRRYRDNLRRIVDQILEGDGYHDVSFQVGGTDFLYEPYGVYYYYSLLEHSVDLDEVEAGNTYLVFDMGGSTTDVAVVQINRRESDFRLYPLCTSIPCAGAYFDQYILKDFLGRNQVPRRDKKWIQYLDRIERAKIAICEGRKDYVELTINEDEGGTFRLDQERIERLLREIWQDKNQPLGPGFRGFLSRVQRLAREHGQLLEFDRIESVFLAGGSTGLPGLEDLIRDDLRELELLDSRDKKPPICVRPRRRLFSGRSAPNSSLAVLGQSASIAEETQERLLEEGEAIYALVVDEDGQPYPFHRSRSPIDQKHAEAQQDGEFLVCTLDELEEREVVRLEPDGHDRFEDHKGSEEYPLLSEAEVYFRADVNGYSDDPDRHFVRENSYGSDSSQPEEESKWRSRFSALAELRPDRLRVKPFIWNVNPRNEERSVLSTEEEGYLSVSLRPELDETDAVHVCIDLGMNNTAVAIYAADQQIPPDAELESFSLHSRPPSPSAAAQSLLPDGPLGEEEAVRRVVKAHSTIGYRPRLEGAYRLLRGAAVQALGDADDLKIGEAAHRLSRSLGVMVSGLKVPRDTLVQEGKVARRLYHSTRRPKAFLRQVIENLAATDHLSLGDISKKVSREEARREEEEKGASGDALRPDTGVTPIASGSADGDAQGNGNSEGSERDDLHSSATREEAASSSHQPETPSTPMEDEEPATSRSAANDQGEDSEKYQSPGRPNATRSMGEDRDGASVAADGHWAVGMAQWMETTLREALSPLRQSNQATRQAVERMADKIEDVGDEQPTELPAGEKVVEALRDIQETLDDLSEDQREKGDIEANEVDVKREVERKVEDDQSPLSRLASGTLDLSLDAFESFVEQRGYIYPQEVLRRAWMHCQSQASGLVILAGPPGSGKTSLVRLLAEFFNRDLPDEGWESFHLLEPVSPSWFSPESLLGSKSVMTGKYQFTPFLKFLIRAESHYFKAMTGPGEEHTRLFVACLDEFNIAQPEQYLADILSKMEARPGSKDRRLHLGTDSAEGEAFQVDLTANLKLFATINTDSTTKTLSPKVLDRAIYVPVSPELDSLEQAAKQVKERYDVGDDFHRLFLDVLGELSHLSRTGQAPIAYRSIEQGYRYASSHPSTEEDTKAVVGDVLISFFLSKLPGAYAINDPAGDYKDALAACDKLRTFDEVDRLLDRIERGLPGQAAL